MGKEQAWSVSSTAAGVAVSAVYLECGKQLKVAMLYSVLDSLGIVN